MEQFKITLTSMQPVDFGDLTSDGFEKLLAAAGIEAPFDWQQDADGKITVMFQHQAADADRAMGASERVANELGIGAWDVRVEEA
jgi:hypothetical protein